LVYHRVITEQPANTGVKLEGLTGESLDQRQMFERNHFLPPLSPPSGFELAIPGKQSKFITLEQFTPFEFVQRDMVLECAGNGRALMKPPPPGTQWALDGVSAITVGGYRLNEVLGTLPDDVTEVVFTGADIGTVAPEGRIPYQFSISRDLAMSNVPLLVTHIGGEALTLAHGAPIRLVVPGHYAISRAFRRALSILRRRLRRRAVSGWPHSRAFHHLVTVVRGVGLGRSSGDQGLGLVGHI
jgi:hypothetical protein